MAVAVGTETLIPTPRLSAMLLSREESSWSYSAAEAAVAVVPDTEEGTGERARPSSAIVL